MRLFRRKTLDKSSVQTIYTTCGITNSNVFRENSKMRWWVSRRFLLLLRNMHEVYHELLIDIKTKYFCRENLRFTEPKHVVRRTTCCFEKLLFQEMFSLGKKESLFCSNFGWRCGKKCTQIFRRSKKVSVQTMMIFCCKICFTDTIKYLRGPFGISQELCFRKHYRKKNQFSNDQKQCDMYSCWD